MFTIQNPAGHNIIFKASNLKNSIGGEAHVVTDLRRKYYFVVPNPSSFETSEYNHKVCCRTFRTEDSSRSLPSEH